MIGDAPGDMKAAHASGALFFPIVPGDEEESSGSDSRRRAREVSRGARSRAYETS